MRVSVCMIVRNEEELLPTALASTVGLADEVVVVDTGSDDGTVEVARGLGAIVETGADRMHKAESRNRAMERATGDWVVILDADERIGDPAGVRSYLETTEARALYIRLTYMEGDRETLSFQQMRIWQRGTFRYRYRAHELPVPVDGWGKVVHTDFVWEHRQPPERGAWKSDYTLDRLVLDVRENPYDPRPRYYLGRQWMYRGEWAKALKELGVYLEAPGVDRADAWQCVARCHAGLGDRAAQIEALHRACAAQPGRRDWWGELGAIYHEAGDDQTAVALLRCALEIPPPQHIYTVQYWYGAAPHDLLARCLWKRGRYAEGYEEAAKALELAPSDARLRRNLQFFVEKLGAAQPAAYYDSVWQAIAEDPARMRGLLVLAGTVASYVLGRNVLDLGCGLGILADMVQGHSYVGVDFSRFAIEYAMRHTLNADALFVLADIRGMVCGLADTVVLQEVLEHVEDPAALVARAERSARKRLIVTVPVEMADPGHVKAAWSEEELRQLLGGLRICNRVEGTWWLAVKDVQD